MKIDVVSLGKKNVGTIDLPEDIFGITPRKDILHRVVRWQLSKRQQGSHSVLTRSEVSYSTRKIVRQKGSGGARHGSRRAPIFRKGGVYKGPTPRSHEHKLTKKFKALGLKHALSSKFNTGNLVVLDNLDMKDYKTKILAGLLVDLSWRRALIIDGYEINENFIRASKNIRNLDVLPSTGINVYDILRKDTLVLTKNAVDKIKERYK